MEDKLYFDTYELKDALISSNEYKNLKEAEKKLEEDEEIMVLSYKKDMIILEYEDKLKIYDKNHAECLKTLQNLNKIVEILNSKQVVKEYNKAYKEYKILEEAINKEIFEGILND